jgi:RNA polymerase sigma-70 factor (ECF subfamily)
LSHSTESIWEAFSGPLRKFIRVRVRDDDEAEDLLQEVFIRIHTRIDTLEDHTRLAAWVYQIARNLIVDTYRARREVLPLPEVVPVQPEFEDSSAEAQIAAGLEEMVSELPDKYSQALLLTEFQGMKQTELAERLGISVSGAKSRVQRGREMLRQSLLDCCHFEFDRQGGVIAYESRPDCCEACRV